MRAAKAWSRVVEVARPASKRELLRPGEHYVLSARNSERKVLMIFLTSVGGNFSLKVGRTLYSGCVDMERPQRLLLPPYHRAKWRVQSRSHAQCNAYAPRSIYGLLGVLQLPSLSGRIVGCEPAVLHWPLPEFPLVRLQVIFR